MKTSLTRHDGTILTVGKLYFLKEECRYGSWKKLDKDDPSGKRWAVQEDVLGGAQWLANIGDIVLLIDFATSYTGIGGTFDMAVVLNKDGNLGAMYISRLGAEITDGKTSIPV